MKFVYCTLQREKLHKWRDAKKYTEVSYLLHLHRHVFHFKVAVEVHSDDREIEFIMLKHRIEKLVDGWGDTVGSCEMMCDDILAFLEKTYPGRKYRVSVAEDGENGAEVET
jgi:hypothetical protein